MRKGISDQDFAISWQKHKSPSKVAEQLGISVRAVHERRNNIERKMGIVLETNDVRAMERPRITVPKEGYRAFAKIRGSVMVFSDGHFWPGERSKAFDAFIKLIPELKPALIICNGDAFDGARISRHMPGGWADLPEVQEELEAVQERLAEIEYAAPDKCPLIWCAGNHDSRFSGRLAQTAPDFIKIKGFDLADHFPAWQFTWSVFVNDNTVIKHRHHQGIHAGYNNTLKGGRTVVTGHTHRLLAMPYNDYNGLRWGIETGTMSEIVTTNDKYSYAEDNPLNWSQGFVVLTFNEAGHLMEPEFCRVIHGQAYFRGRPL